MAEKIITYSKDDIHTSYWIDNVSRSLNAIARPRHTFLYGVEDSFPADMAVFTLKEDPETVLAIRHTLERNEAHSDHSYTVSIHTGDIKLFYSSAVHQIHVNRDAGMVSFDVFRKTPERRYPFKAELFWTGNLDLLYLHDGRQRRLSITP